MIAAVLAATLSAATLDLSHAQLIVATDRTGPEDAASRLLRDDVATRSGVTWSAEGRGPRVILARCSQVRALLPAGMRAAWGRPCAAVRAAEGFRVRVLRGRRSAVVVAAGADARGVLFAAGYLLRKLETGPGQVRLPASVGVTTAPAQPIRGDQIGYRAKNNSYDAWTLPMLERRLRDFAIFGANTIQMIAPNSDDAAASPLFSAPALDTLVGVSRLTATYGLDFALFYPEMRADYGDPAQVAAELNDFEALIGKLDHLNAVYIPGGDPGHTAPDALFGLVAKEAAILRRRHPSAQVWISGQGFDAAAYERFYDLLKRRPTWLTGVFVGPQSRDPIEVQRRRIPAVYPLVAYPDIGHAMHAQFPVPRWSPAFAVTEGREPIIPRPLAEAAIFAQLRRTDIGAVTYSEGVNDDVNALLWFQLGWSPARRPRAILCDYARTFLGARVGDRSSDAFAGSLAALERNWIGDPARNRSIDVTLARLERLEAIASPEQRSNWRFESALYRGVYDAYVRGRLRGERGREAAALAVLRTAATNGTAAAIAEARRALAVPDTPRVQKLRSRLFDLAARLWAHARLQLSVARYGASSVERGANLDRVDASLNDRVWIERAFDTIAALPDEAAKLERLRSIVDWPMRAAGARYDDLGDPDHEPHLRRPRRAERLHPDDGAQDGVADTFQDDGWRTSWVTYAETHYDAALTLDYTGLGRARTWRVRVTYAGEAYWSPMRLTDGDGREIHPLIDRTQNPMVVEAAIPAASIHAGRLTLHWVRPPGSGGGGRGHQVAEVWLIPSPREPTPSIP